MKECALRKDSLVAEAIENLPTAQKLAVQECFSAAKKAGKRGRRYTLDWVFECLLMRIKSPTLYEHIRKKDVLPLPTQTTLLHYLSSFDVGFGFKKETFEALRKKASCMSMQQRRGNLRIIKHMRHYSMLLVDSILKKFTTKLNYFG